MVGAAVDMLGVMYLGRLVEPIWGAAEFVHFVVVVNICVGACTFVTMYTLYIVTRSQFYLFAKFSGFHGILAALMVALRQLLPEERVPLPPPLGSVLRVRNKHLPGIYCTSTALLCVVSGAEHHHIGLYLFVAFGAYSGWCYLRYFQSRARGGVGGGGGGDDVEVAADGADTSAWRGDDSEEFAFAAQFPLFLQPVLRRLTDPCHALFCSPLSSGKPLSHHQHHRHRHHLLHRQHGGGRAATDSATDAPRSGGAAAGEETDRRKELASRGARLLEERMARGITAAGPKPGATLAGEENAVPA